MAIDLGSSNTTRYHSVPDHADFSLPNSDWAWVTLCYPQSSADIKYLVSTGNFGVANSLNLIVYNNTGFSVKIDTRSEDIVTTTITLNKWHWLYATRRSNVVYCGMVPVGSSSITESPGSVLTVGYDSSTGPNIGRRSDGTTTRYWKGRWGQVAFISGAGITSDQVVELAKGASLLSMPFAPNIKALWHGRNASDATIADLIGGHVATKQGTSYGTLEEDIQVPYIWVPSYSRGIVSSGGTTYTISPTGQVSLSGTNDLLKTKVFLPSGNILFTGASNVVKTKIINPSGNVTLSGAANIVKGRILSPSGGLSLSGSATPIRSKIIAPTGSITFSGTASLSGAMSYLLSPSGQVTLSGTSKLIKTHIHIPTGGIVFSGSAPITSNTVLEVVSTRLPLTGVGL